MHIHKGISTFILILSLLFFVLILCTDPAKPDFTEAATFTYKQIQTSGTPVMDSAFLLYVLAEGTAPLSFQWYKNDQEIINARDDTLAFNALTLSDAGNYRCIVSNDYGEDSSLVCTLKILMPPAIITPNKQIQTAPAVPQLDSAFTMAIEASGSDTLKYKWYRDTILLQESISDSLKFAALAYSDTGSYRCVVANTLGSDTSAIFTLSIAVNNPPVWVRDTMVDSAGIGAAFTITLTDSCTDSDSDIIVFSLGAGTPVGDSIISDTIYLFTPTVNDTGIYLITLYASDGKDADTAVLKLVIADINVPPQWVREIMIDTVKEAAAFSITLTDSCYDPNSDTIIFTLGPGTPVGDTITSDSIYTYTPSFDDAGDYYINLWAKDKSDSSLAILKLTVIDSNRAPLFKDSLPLDLYRINLGSQLLIRFEAEDPDGDTAIVFLDSLSTTLPHQETIVFSDSQLVWQSTSADSGAFVVVLGVTDLIHTNTIEITVTVGNVNLPPKIEIGTYQDGDTVPVTETKPLALTVTVTDPDTGQTPVLTSPLNLPTGATFDTASGSFAYTPDFTISNQQANTTFPNVTFYATDNVLRLSDTFTIHITVLDSNRAPVCKDTSLSVNEGGTVPVDLFAADPDSDPLAWTIAAAPKYGSTDTTGGAIGTTPEFIYTAGNVVDTLTDTIGIAINDGKSQSLMNVIVTIYGDNDPPVATPIDTLKLTEDQTTSLRFDVSGTDPENQLLTWEIIANPTKGTLTKLHDTISTTLEAELTPAGNAFGIDSFAFRVSDGVNISQNVTVFIFITPVNDTPTVTIDTFPSTTPYKQTANITAAFSDVEGGIDSIYFIIDAVIDTAVKIPAGYSEFTHPWTAPFGPRVIGPHHIMVVVTDVDKARDTSQTVTVNITGTLESDTLSVRVILDANGLTTAPVSSVVTISSNRVTQLWPSDRGLTTLPEEITNLTMLNMLDLTYNSFTNLPSYIGDLSTLTKCYLFGNSLVSLPPEIGNLTNLTDFEAHLNQLSALPPELGNLINLTNLQLYNNLIPSLPAEIGKLTKLTILSLSYNKLTVLPTDIGKLTELTNLNLSSNEIQELPSDIGNLEKLSTFYVQYNKLRDLPDEIVRLGNVGNTTCDLGYNYLPTQTSQPWWEWADAKDPDWRETQQTK